MFDNALPISYYKVIAELNHKHQIYIVQHIESKKIYIKKVMPVYNLAVFEQLFKHPVKNTPRIYAIYEHNNTLTTIEEYISGDSLQEVIDICGKIPERDTVNYAIQLCSILSELHTPITSIIHRDIKPSNIILTEDGRIILIDFNAAKQFLNANKTRDTRLLGTEGFAAPEQFGFGSSSCQTDIYAVGNLLKELTGLADDSSLKLSPKLITIINRCLELNPKDRYVTAVQLKLALERL